jgi:hypothetical protein
MAKMRGIKPETFTDDKILQVEPLARWLFVGMWTQACDNGHVEDNHVQLKVRLLAVDNCDVDDLITQLVHAGLITRHDGFLKIPNLTKHQKIDKRYLVFCKWCENDADLTFKKEDKQTRDRSKKQRAHRAHDGQTANAQGVPGDEGEGEGEGERDMQSKPSRKTRIPDNWEPTEEHSKRAAEKNLDIQEEAEKFRNHALANDRKAVRWNHAFTNWLINARPKPQETYDPWQM